MNKSVMTAIGVATLCVAGGARALAQGDVLFPGSTAPGDALRGQGVMYKGAAVLHLNAAKARSIDAETQIRFNQYVYDSYREYLRQRSLRIARSTANRNAGAEEVRRRLRERPTESDVAGGDALNVVLVDLADPRLPAAAWEAAKVPLPAEAARKIPFQHASAGGTLALRRLDVGDDWPVALRYKALEEPRRAYQQAVATLLEQCRGHRLTPEAVEAVGATARALGARADAAIPQASQDYRREALRFTGALERSARALTRSAYVEDLLGELDGFRGSMIADLVDLMRRYNLHFGPADDPVERGMYQELYPLLVRQRAAFGSILVTAPSTPVTTSGERRVEARGGLPFRRVRVSVGVDGACDLLVDAGDREVASGSRAGELKLAGLSDARIVRGQDSRLDILHDFRQAKGIADFGRTATSVGTLSLGLSLDRTDGTLVLSPAPTPGEKGKRAVLNYPRQLKLPVAITLVFERWTGGTLVVQVEKIQPDEKLAVRVNPGDKRARGHLNATWHPLDRGTSKRGEALSLYDRPIEPGRPAEHTVQLPPEALSPEDRICLKVAYFAESPAAIRSIEVEANVVPSFGAALDMNPSQSVVVVKALVKGSPAERSGLRQGDLIKSIAGTEPKDLKEAMSLLGQAPVGEPVKVEVLRGGKPMAISIKAE